MSRPPMIGSNIDLDKNNQSCLFNQINKLFNKIRSALSWSLDWVADLSEMLAQLRVVVWQQEEEDGIR